MSAAPQNNNEVAEKIIRPLSKINEEIKEVEAMNAKLAGDRSLPEALVRKIVSDNIERIAALQNEAVIAKQKETAGDTKFLVNDEGTIMRKLAASTDPNEQASLKAMLRKMQVERGDDTGVSKVAMPKDLLPKGVITDSTYFDGSKGKDNADPNFKNKVGRGTLGAAGLPM